MIQTSDGVQKCQHLVQSGQIRTVEELRSALHEWLKPYNEHWLIERHGYRPPAQLRREYLALQEAD